MIKSLKKILAGFFLAGFFLARLPCGAFSAETLNVIAVGDQGNGSERQKFVGNAMGEVSQRENVSFILLLGDNFYRKGVKSVEDKQWKRKFEEMYDHPGLQIPFYAVLGNHDYGKDPDAQVKYTKKSKRWKMPAKYYTFTQKLDDGTEIEFFGLDTMQIERKKKRQKHLEWLKDVLSQSKAQWKIVYAHHPVYSDGKHGDMGFAIKYLEPLLIEHKVDLYLAGHDHSLQVMKPVSGVQYIISGTGCAPSHMGETKRHFFASTTLGFALLRISGDQIAVDMIDYKERVLYTHTIKKAQERVLEEALSAVGA